MQQQYAKALYELEQAGTQPEALFVKLDAVLKARGHEKLKKRILIEYRKLHEGAASGSAILTVAKEGDYELLRSDITEAAKLLGITDTPTLQIDPESIGGFALEHNGKHIDKTYKTALLNLYRNVIK